MATLQSKVTSKGQVTLPKTLRSKLGIKTGDRLEFTLEAPNRASLAKKSNPGSSTGCGKRFLSADQGPATVEEMDAGIRKSVVKRFRASNEHVG